MPGRAELTEWNGCPLAGVLSGEASSRIDKDELKDLSTDDDKVLLRRARSGDRDAFAAIVRGYQAPALRLATAISGDSTEAYDIVQEAFVRAHRALGTVRDDEALRPWLLRIVANQAKNVQRGRWRRETRHQRHAALRATEPAGPDELALSGIEAQHLLLAISRLSPNDRTVIACRYFAGLSEAETAVALGLANGTVKSRTARALARLREQVGPRDEAGTAGGLR